MIKYSFVKIILISVCFLTFELEAGDFVFKVSDGDTIHVMSEAGVKRKVRLSRIDAPELNQECCKDAADHLSSLILGKVVEVESLGKDRYGRSLDIVYRQLNPTNRVDLNLQMVKDGRKMPSDKRTMVWLKGGLVGAGNRE